MPAATQTEEVTFVAKWHELKVIRSPALDLFLPNGNVTVDPKHPEVAIQFKGGTYRTSDEDEIAFLRAHEEFGTGFFEPGIDPIAPEPTDELAAIVDASLRLEADTLRRILDEERSGWSRAQVIELAERAIEQIEAVQGSPTSGDEE